MTTDPGVHHPRAASTSLIGATAARTALTEAGPVRERLADRARWVRRSSLVMAAGTAVVVLAVGATDLTVVFVTVGVFLVGVGVLCSWTLRQGVVRRGTPRLHVTTMVVRAVLYGAALQVGINLFPGVVGFWVLAASAAGEALPSAAGAAPSPLAAPAVSSGSSTADDPVTSPSGAPARARPPHRGAQPRLGTAACG